jgi:hypothetical protein
VLALDTFEWQQVAKTTTATRQKRILTGEAPAVPTATQTQPPKRQEWPAAA